MSGSAQACALAGCKNPAEWRVRPTGSGSWRDLCSQHLSQLMTEEELEEIKVLRGVKRKAG
jgi:hypothetical protein